MKVRILEKYPFDGHILADAACGDYAEFLLKYKNKILTARENLKSGFIEVLLEGNKWYMVGRSHIEHISPGRAGEI